MRKTIRVGIILLVVGLLLIMFGIANNGIQSVYWDQGFHIVRHKTRRYHVSQLKDITIATANNITIKQGTAANITVTATRALPMVTSLLLQRHTTPKPLASCSITSDNLLTRQ